MASDPQTWAELKTSLAEWLNRSDLTAKIPELIAFAERKWNRVLIVPEREVRTSAATAEAHITLPADLWQVRTIHIDADPIITLEQLTPAELLRTYPSAVTGKPKAFALIGGEVHFGPAPDGTYTFTIDYYQTIPALGASQATNWLLTAHPDLYLYGSLLQAEAYLFNDKRLEVWKAAHDEVLAEIMQAGSRKRYGATPVRLRNPVRGWV